MSPSLMRSAQNALIRMAPGPLFWRSYAKNARRAGLEQLYIILSYDCDTPEDAAASTGLYAWLAKHSIPATFAVPGAQLEESRKEYRALHRQGAAFINHGGAPHTEFREGRYHSVTFYERIDAETVAADIRLGHEIFKRVLGAAPRGFRAPHFGHFQRPEQLRLIYDTLRELGGYRFSSTTTSAFAQRYGPVVEADGLMEIPILGSYHWPLRIFDSYRYISDRVSRKVTDDYARDFFSTVENLIQQGIPALLNYYADPAHVIDNEAYLDALARAQGLGAQFISYEQLLEIAQPWKRLA
jgi:peptidoglycan/xylan/chitin deacetylase (PgdA/CDA1 family)